MPNRNERMNVLGVGISITNIAKAVDEIQGWIERHEPHYICVTGVHGVMESQKNADLKRIHNQSGLTVPDGMPMVWVGHLKRYPNIERVYGPDLMMEICKISLRKGYSHFFYGGEEGVAKKLQENLEEKFPGIHIVGTYTPPFRSLNKQEEAELIEKIAKAKPDLFWVGLSTPKQEHFMANYLPRLNTKVMIGVGAAFDIHTGRIKDAPQWVKKMGLQWAHRLGQEPRRLWKRYLYNNPKFVYLFLKEYDFETKKA
jgi:N-acetylglucosaminyldiphosphoundecaprenol N-acetyl-beta-D-mannosaminyltransferase